MTVFPPLADRSCWGDVRRRFVEAQRRWRAFLPEAGRWGRVEAEMAVLEGRWAGEAERPPLFGVPVGVKDVFRVEGLPTRAGTRLPPAVFAGAEAESVRRLRGAGAVVLGKTVTTELAYYEPGRTRNPRAPGRTPGGSSSGSAAAVAAGVVPLALGTQTIGSVCRPAAFCGIVGFKPSYERVPRDGVVPLAPSLDHVGVLAASVEWARRAAAVLLDGWEGGGGPHEPWAAGAGDALDEAARGSGAAALRGEGGPGAAPGAVGGSTVDVAGAVGQTSGGPAVRQPALARPTLGVPVGSYLEAAEPVARHHLRATQRRLLTAGWPVREVPVMADFAAIASRHHRLLAAEAAAVHADLLAAHGDRLRPRTVEMLERGRGVPPAETEAAQEARAALRRELEQAMSAAAVDLWLSPAAPGPPPAGLAATGDPVMNLPWTQAGLPVVALPAGATPEGLPLGIQLTGRFGADEALLAWAAELAPVLEQPHG